MKLNIKSSTGSTFEVDVNPAVTVAEFKEILREKCNIPAEQQRLIYRGHVLKDVRTLESYSVEEGFTVHLVKGAAQTQASTTDAPAQASTAPPTQPTTTQQAPPVFQQQPQQPPQQQPNPFAAFGAAGAGAGGGANTNTANNANANMNDPFGMGGFGGLGGMGGFPGMGGMGMGGLGGMGMDPNQLQAAMRNPMFQQMMQQMLSNPQIMQQMIQNNPTLNNMVNQNPQLRTMLSNPEFLRQMANPQNLQMMLQMQQAMQGLQGAFGGAGAGAGAGTGAGAGAGADANNAFADPFGLGGFGGMGMGGLGGMGGFGVPRATAETYRAQLQQLNDMGFFDEQQNLEALAVTGGNVNAAVEYLLSNPPVPQRNNNMHT